MYNAFVSGACIEDSSLPPNGAKLIGAEQRVDERYRSFGEAAIGKDAVACITRRSHIPNAKRVTAEESNTHANIAAEDCFGAVSVVRPESADIVFPRVGVDAQAIARDESEREQRL